MDTHNRMDTFGKSFGKNKPLVFTVVAIAGALLIFELGAAVGYRQALFSSRGGERYMQMMEGGNGNAFFVNRGQMHGATGRIVSVDLPSFTVVGPDNVEKTVMVNGSTMITRFRAQ